jgi:hypothetical protein
LAENLFNAYQINASGGRSVGIVRLRNNATEFFYHNNDSRVGDDVELTLK